MDSNFTHKFMWNCGNVVFDILKMFNNLCLFLKLVDTRLKLVDGIFGVSAGIKDG